MTRLRPLALGLVGLLALPGPAAAPPSCTAPTLSGEPLLVEVLEPLPGTVASFPGDCCSITTPVLGTASVGFRLFDLYFVIDSSGSTAACSGVDIDRDGTVGQPNGTLCTDPDDSVLAAELRAIELFVGTLSPTNTRVAIIQFSNPEGFLGVGERQRLVQPLTDDFALVLAALDDVLAGGSAGATDYAGGLTLTLSEHVLRGDPTTRRQIAFFLSDGIPTFPVFPYSSEEPGDSQASIDTLDALAAFGVVVNSFGVGFTPSMTLDPILPERCLKRTPSGPAVVSTLECLALRSGGAFYASNDPADILTQLLLVLPTVGIQSVIVRDETTGVAVPAALQGDGSFIALLPVYPNVVNDVRVTAVAEDGTSCDAFTDIEPLCAGVPFDALPPRPPGSPGSPASPLPPCSAASPASPVSAGHR